MGREIYDIINDMAEVLTASQMQKLQEVLVKRLSENTVSDYLQTTQTFSLTEWQIPICGGGDKCIIVLRG